MQKNIMQFFLFVFCFYLLSCSSNRNCSQDTNYRIEYFSGGGFTGLERGIIIDCSGFLKNQERKLNSERTIIDSIKIDSSVMDRLDELMKDPKIFNYKMKADANYTKTFIISNQEKKNTISYNPAEVPKDIPKSIKAIIYEIEKIKK